MNRIFVGFLDCFKKKKGLLIFLIILSITALILGVIASVNFGGGVFSIDLSNIAYIKFLKGDCGMMSMVFGLILSLIVFFLVCLVCYSKTWLISLGIMFYLYLVNSQAVVFMSIILIYGFFNCVILSLILLVYTLIVWFVFLMLQCELACLTNSYDYFKCCCSFNKSRVMWLLCVLIALSFVFSLILMVLKNYVVLLIF